MNGTKEQDEKLRQLIAGTGNELYRWKKHEKATKKEKDILKDLKAKIRSQEVTNQEFRDAKEERLDKLRYSKVLSEKMIRRCRKVHNNARFRENEGRFYRKMNRTKNFTGTVPEIEKFGEVCGSKKEQQKNNHGCLK